MENRKNEFLQELRESYETVSGIHGAKLFSLQLSLAIGRMADVGGFDESRVLRQLHSHVEDCILGRGNWPDWPFTEPVEPVDKYTGSLW